MTKALAVVALGGVGVLSAGSSSAQLTVGVTVVRSCAVDARPADSASPPLRLTCTTGARSNVKVSESIQAPARAESSNDLRVVTLNF